MNIVIWGVGKNLYKYIEKIDLKDVYCFIDKSKDKQQCDFYGKPILNPDHIKKINYDFIVISSDLYFLEIAQMLLFQYSIECKKIIKLSFYLNMKNNYVNIKENIIFKNLIKMCFYYGLHKILDIGLMFGRMTQLGIGVYPNINMIIDGLTEGERCLESRRLQYRKIYKDGCEVYNYYDAVLISNYYGQEALEKGKKLLDISSIIIFYISSDIVLKEETYDFSIINMEGFLIGILQKEKKNIEIYEATHKRFKPINEMGYIPILLGNKKISNLEYIRDNTGENISFLNDKINECTGLYWLWKNIKVPYIGLNHYRRLFSSQINDGWAAQNIELQILLQTYDIITAEPVYLWDESVKETLKLQVCEEAFDNALCAVYDIFRKKGKKEYDAFEDVITGHMFYPCNMFAAKYAIFNEYCEWLFPIVFELVRKVEIKSYWDNYSKRILGFWAERLFTVWLIQKKYKIKSIPILLIGSGVPYGKE